MSAPENSKPSLRIPPWLRVKLPCNHTFSDTRALVEGLDLHTVCHSAKCPNMFECFSRKTATFLILGNTCTRTGPSRRVTPVSSPKTISAPTRLKKMTSKRKSTIPTIHSAVNGLAPSLRCWSSR